MNNKTPYTYSPVGLWAYLINDSEDFDDYSNYNDDLTEFEEQAIADYADYKNAIGHKVA